MKLRFTEQQAAAMFELFNTEVLPDAPVALEDKLIMLHLLNIYRKLRAKLEGGFKYNINISEAEAIAYRCYFYHKNLTAYVYENNLVTMHCIDIDAELAKRVYFINPEKIKLLK